MEQRTSRGPRLAGLILGALLVIAGAVLLVGQFYGFELRLDLARIGWPLYVILPGLALLLVGLVLYEEPGVGLSIAGAIVTTVGLILAYQDATGHWASWAYAWSLIAPTSVGAAMVLWGALHLRGNIVRSGLSAMAVGVVLFLVFFGFFEGVLGIGGDRGLAGLGRTALPIALIVGGLLIITARLWPRRRVREERAYRAEHPMPDAPPSQVVPPQEAAPPPQASPPQAAPPPVTEEEAQRPDDTRRWPD